MAGIGLAGAASVVASVERSAEMEAVQATIRAFAAPAGLDRFLLYAAGPSVGHDIERLLWLEGDFFGDGRSVTPEVYLARCPVHRHILETDRPFFWSKTGEPGCVSYRVVRRPRGPGIHGLQVPVFGQAGLIGAMSFAGAAIDSAFETTLALTLVANAAFHTAMRLASAGQGSAMPQLTDREREVIRLVAAGRRQTDIALLLGLSDRTVENHLRSIRRRLGASSTAQAVHLAARGGALGPSDLS